MSAQTLYVRIANGLHRGQVINGVYPLYQTPRYTGSQKLILKIVSSPIVPPFTVPTPAINIVANTNVEFFKDADCTVPATDAEVKSYASPLIAHQISRTATVLQTTTDPLAAAKIGTQLSQLSQISAVVPGMPSIDDLWNDPEAKLRSMETDEEAIARIKASFEEMEDIVSCVGEGVIRGLIVAGLPGVGKSHNIQECLRAYEGFGKLTDTKTVTYVSGKTTPLALYMSLWESRGPDQLVVYDDCDSVLWEEDSQNILKAALDSRAVRRITWNTTSRVLDKADIPNSFDFEGRIIFITNINFARMRDSKVKAHLDAIRSRCHYFNLTMGSARDIILRIKYMVSEGMLNKYGFPPELVQEIVDFVEEHQVDLEELSLRMVTKIADLAKGRPDRWKRLARTTCMHQNAKYKHLLSEKTNAQTEEGVAE